MICGGHGSADPQQSAKLLERLTGKLSSSVRDDLAWYPVVLQNVVVDQLRRFSGGEMVVGCEEVRSLGEAIRYYHNGGEGVAVSVHRRRELGDDIDGPDLPRAGRYFIRA